RSCQYRLGESISSTVLFPGGYTVADKKFNIVFSGKLVEGSKPPDVLNKLGMVLGLENAQVRDLFKPGAGAIILKDLDSSTANALLGKLQGAGAICTVKEVEPAPARESFSADLEPTLQSPVKSQKQGIDIHTRQVNKGHKKSSVDKEQVLPSGAVPGITLGGEPLVAPYLPGKKTAVIIGAIFGLWLLISGINSNEIALHLLSVVLLSLYKILLIEC